jgi:hypothetical protein
MGKTKIAFVLLVLGACSDRVDHVYKPQPPLASGPSVRFSLAAPMPDYLDVPFPSDIYRVGDKIVDPVPNLGRVLFANDKFISHELARFNGFSRIAMAHFWFDDPDAPKDDEGKIGSAIIDPKSLPVGEEACIADGSSVFLVDLEATDPAQARVRCRSGFHTNGENSASRPALAIGPSRGIVLAEGHRYAAVVTSRVRDKKGRPIGPSPDFAAILAGDRAKPASQLYGAALDKLRTLLGPALASDKAEIIGVAPYTTINMTRELYTLRENLEKEPAPVLKWDVDSVKPMVPARFAAGIGAPIFTATLDAWLGTVSAPKLPDGSDDPDRDLPVRAHDKIAAMGTGVFQAVSYVSTEGGSYENPNFGTFMKDASGAIVKDPAKPLVKIWVTIAVPTAPPPAGGYPAVIFQHGLGGSRSDFLSVANVIAAKGWVGVAIDSITFGARAASTSYQNDANSDYEKAPGASYKGPDGLADTFRDGRNGPFDLFGGLKNLGALRDQFRQTALDTVQVVRMLRSNPDLSPLKTGATDIKIDPERIAYSADSLGAIQGATAAAIEPNVKHWFLNVGGAGLLMELAAHSPAISIQLGLAGGLNFGLVGDTYNDTHPFVSLAQLIAEAGDPLSYAEFLVKNPQTVNGVKMTPRNILQTEVIYDELVCNEANEALARAAGYGLAIPNVGPNAELSDIKNPAANPFKTPLLEVAPDGTGAIHDSPMMGTTAVVVQLSPSGHGYDLTNGKANRHFAIPYGQFGTANAFPFAPKDYKVRTSYREVQAMLAHFFEDGFAGKVPRVSGFKPPVRDVDDDGAPDNVDPAPDDPTVH